MLLKYSGEKGAFSRDVTKPIDYSYKKMNLDLYFTPYRKINSRWTVDLNIKGKTIKLLQGNTGEHLHDLGVGKLFLHKT